MTKLWGHIVQFGVSSLVVLLSILPVQAQESPQILYPETLPPPQYDPNLRYSAPQTEEFRLIVNSDSPELLAQVQRIEPTAFLTVLGRRRVIQVGSFSTAQAAQQRAQIFADRGILAQVYADNDRPPINPAKTTRGYAVVLPTANQTTAQALNTKLLQVGIPARYLLLRAQPIGLHWAIGVYSDRANAESMNAYLLRQGFDSRVFWQN